MILKKYRIEPIGAINAVYKRIKIKNKATQDDICSLCGVGQAKCKTTIIYYGTTENLTIFDICYDIELIKILYDLETKNNITYIPWKIR